MPRNRVRGRKWCEVGGHAGAFGVAAASRAPTPWSRIARPQAARRAPQLARGPSRHADEETDAACLWPLPRASQNDEEAGVAESSHAAGAKPAKKQKRGNMTGDEWADAHGEEWQKFLKEKLKRCECSNPRTSMSQRRKALKQDEREGIAPGIPAACLLCFAPIDMEVRPPPSPSPSPTPAPRSRDSSAAPADCMPAPAPGAALWRDVGVGVRRQS